MTVIINDGTPCPKGRQRWVAYSKDEYGHPAEEVDLDVSPRTSQAEIKRVAQAYLSSDEFEEGLTVTHVERKEGMYL